MRKILIANIFGIGDVLFTTPLAASLQKEVPGIEIDYLANARTKDLIACVPGVRKTHVYEKDHFVALWRSSKLRAFGAYWKLFTDVKREKYDAVFDLTLARKFGFFFMMAGIRKRIGLDYKKRGTFLTHKVVLSGFSGRHVAEYYLDLLALLGLGPSARKMSLVPPADLSEWAGGYLRSNGIDPGKLVVVVPGGGASWSSHSYRKRWMPEGFARVAGMLAKEGWNVLVIGDSSERGLCMKVAQASGIEGAAYESGLDLKKYVALLSKAKLVLCNDGGPLHMAVALGIRTVSIFGPVDPAVYGPYPPSDEHRVIVSSSLSCRPCYKRFRLPKCDYDARCLSDVLSEKVFDACEDLLAKR